jgi:hypothetical protein
MLLLFELAQRLLPFDSTQPIGGGIGVVSEHIVGDHTNISTTAPRPTPHGPHLLPLGLFLNRVRVRAEKAQAHLRTFRRRLASPGPKENTS